METKAIEADFGDPIVKTFAKTEKTYMIVSGNLPLAEDDENAYSANDKKTLVAAYKQADAERVEKARSSVATETASSVSPAAAAMGALTRRSSLI
jgi:hypothetical protein